MRLRARGVRAVIGVLLAVPLMAAPASAHHERRDRIEVRGTVVAIDRFAGRFHLRTRSGFDHVFLVLVDHRTDFDIERRRLHDDDGDDRVLHVRRFRLLAVGDFVEVEGRLVGHRTILAREVKIFGRVHAGVFPAVVPAPVIFFPHHGAVIAGPEFFLTGRTLPRARVAILVVIVLGPVVVRSHSFDVFAEDDGFFTAPIRSGHLQRGLQHRITVRAHLEGVESPPVTMVVHQQ